MSALREWINRFILELEDRQYRPLEVHETVYWKQGKFLSPEDADRNGQPFEQFSDTDRWGGEYAHAWFRVSLHLKPEYAGKCLTVRISTIQEHKNPFHLVSCYAGCPEKRWDIMNPQFIFFLDGKINQGIDVNHNIILIDESCRTEYQMDFCAYGGMNQHLFDFRLEFFENLKVIGELKTDIDMAAMCADMLEEHDSNKIYIMECLQMVIDQVPLYLSGTEEFLQKVRNADQLLKTKIYRETRFKTDVIATCIGHTHIDVGWLWTVEQTREKVLRSFSTVLKLMKHYPQYIFMASQPQLYQFVKEEAPELYEEIRERVKEGRWEAEGSTWVEPDCNLISGESMVRQILYGKQFFREEFGVECKVLWLPDVFGYSAAMPQILKKAEIDYFLTSKISWNQYNKLPFDAFLWKGIDGTEILSYFLTTRNPAYSEGDFYTTYNGEMLPEAIEGGWRRFQQKEVTNEILIAYGYGDGGGGVTAEMLENQERLSKSLPGCPRVQTGTVRGFFDRLGHTVKKRTGVPCWEGELYLENHQGTYTSMALMKQLNRRCEFGMLEAESLCIISGGPEMYEIRDSFQKDWKVIMLNQFHDILPGTCIKEVYDSAIPQMEAVQKRCNEYANQIVKSICTDMAADQDALLIFNMLPFVREGYLKVDGLHQYPNGLYNLRDDDKNRYEAILNNGVLSAWVGQIPSKGWKAFYLERQEKRIDHTTLKADGRILENQYFYIELLQDGTFASMYDKRCSRELLKPGEYGNVLEIYEDIPEKWDTWNIEEYADRKKYSVENDAHITILENNGIVAAVKINKSFHHSQFEQVIRIYRDSERIDIENHIIWKEEGMLLKAVFPFDINTDFCTGDIQFGSVRRPTHNNTSWQQAKYEMCIHKWVDISEKGYGISVLNDCKYGCDIKHGRIRLTLLKAGRAPYPGIDQGEHKFTYSLYPHMGTWEEANTVKEAYGLNLPLRVAFVKKQAGSLPPVYSFASCSAENVVIETLKPAEDNLGIIMRIYESSNRRTNCMIKLSKTYSKIVRCNLLEKEEEVIAAFSNNIVMIVQPFELITIKLVE